MALIWPNGSTTIPRVTSEFNPMRKHPVSGAMRPHRGIDLAGWSQVVSPVAGRVTSKAYQAGGAGNYVNVTADNGDVFKFFHLKSASSLSVGQRVDPGTVIGVMGATGGVTGVHLHFEVWSGGKAVDPRTYYANHGLSAEYQEDDMSAEAEAAIFQIRDVLGARDGLNTRTGDTVAHKVSEIRDAVGATNGIGLAPDQTALFLIRELTKQVGALAVKVDEVHRHLGSAGAFDVVTDSSKTLGAKIDKAAK